MLLEVIFVKKLTDEQLAYIAGIVDGEGWLGINRRKCRETTSGLYYTAVMVVVNTHKPLLDWLQETTGVGSIQTRCRTGKRTSWGWTLWSNHLRELLLLAFLSRNAHNGRGKLTTEQWAERQEMYLACKSLNVRGLAATGE